MSIITLDVTCSLRLSHTSVNAADLHWQWEEAPVCVKWTFLSQVWLPRSLLLWHLCVKHALCAVPGSLARGSQDYHSLVLLLYFPSYRTKEWKALGLLHFCPRYLPIHSLIQSSASFIVAHVFLAQKGFFHFFFSLLCFAPQQSANGAIPRGNYRT